MSMETYRYKQKAIKAARELFYPKSVISDLYNANTISEIARIMKSARERS